MIDAAINTWLTGFFSPVDNNRRAKLRFYFNMAANVREFFVCITLVFNCAVVFPFGKTVEARGCVLDCAKTKCVSCLNKKALCLNKIRISFLPYSHLFSATEICRGFGGKKKQIRTARCPYLFFSLFYDIQFLEYFQEFFHRSCHLLL